MIEASVPAVELADDLRKPQFPNQLDGVASAAAGVAAVAVVTTVAKAVWFSRSSFLAHINGTGPRSYSLRT